MPNHLYTRCEFTKPNILTTRNLLDESDLKDINCLKCLIAYSEYRKTRSSEDLSPRVGEFVENRIKNLTFKNDLKEVLDA